MPHIDPRLLAVLLLGLGLSGHARASSVATSPSDQALPIGGVLPVSPAGAVTPAVAGSSSASAAAPVTTALSLSGIDWKTVALEHSPPRPRVSAPLGRQARLRVSAQQSQAHMVRYAGHAHRRHRPLANTPYRDMKPERSMP